MSAQWAALKPIVGQRQVDLLAVAAVKLNATCVAGNADDLVGRPVGKKLTRIVGPLIGRTQTKTAADGVLAWPELSGGRFADNNGATSLAGFQWKTATEKQGDAQRLEVVCLNVGVVDQRIPVRRLLSIKRDGSRSKAFLGRRPSAGDGNHPGQRSQAGTQLTDESSLAVGGVPRRLGELDVEIDDVFAVVTGVQLERVHGTADQHACGDQEHEGEGDLRGDEQVLEPAAASRRSTGSDGRGERGAGAFNRRGEPNQDAGKQRSAGAAATVDGTAAGSVYTDIVETK
jgi:hypothetical protein